MLGLRLGRFFTSSLTRALHTSPKRTRKTKPGRMKACRVFLSAVYTLLISSLYVDCSRRLLPRRARRDLLSHCFTREAEQLQSISPAYMRRLPSYTERARPTMYGRAGQVPQTWRVLEVGMQPNVSHGGRLTDV